jgi:hypothetical protein
MRLAIHLASRTVTSIATLHWCTTTLTCLTPITGTGTEVRPVPI